MSGEERPDHSDATEKLDIAPELQSPSKPQSLPSVGQIMGFLLKHFGQLKKPFNSKTHQRFFSGSDEYLVTPETKGAILREVAQWIVSEGLLPDTFEKHGYPASQIVQAVLNLHAVEWEAWRSILFPLRVPAAKDSQELLWFPYIRLGTIDLALRIAAGLSLADSLKSRSRVFRWMNQSRPGEFLKVLMQDAGNLTRDQLSEEVSVNPNTVDSWLDIDVRPRDRPLRKLASLFADRSQNVEPLEVEADLRQLYLLNSISSLLREHAGADIVLQARERLPRYIEQAFNYLAADMMTTGATDLPVSVLFLGSRSPDIGPVLTALSRKESAEHWQRALRFAGGDWLKFIAESNIQAILSELKSYPNRHNSLLRKGHEGEQSKVSMLLNASLESYAKGVLKVSADVLEPREPVDLQMERPIRESIRQLEKAVEIEPNNAEAQSMLGDIKLMHGVSLSDETLIQGATNAFWIAAKLNTRWLGPWVGVAEALAALGRNQEALEHLIAVDEERHPLTANYFLELAEVQHNLKLYADCQDSIRRLLDLAPDEPAFAYRATMLAAEQGNKRLAKRYGRSARSLGIPDPVIRSLELQAEQVSAGKRGQ